MGTSLEKDQLIDSRFKVDERIGQGGQGEVYRVLDTASNNTKTRPQNNSG